MANFRKIAREANTYKSYALNELNQSKKEINEYLNTTQALLKTLPDPAK